MIDFLEFTIAFCVICWVAENIVARGVRRGMHQYYEGKRFG